VGLVAEVCAGLKQLLHRDDSGRHRKFLSGCASAEPRTDPKVGTGMMVPHVGCRRR
jgi:hypothetical protein